MALDARVVVYEHFIPFIYSSLRTLLTLYESPLEAFETTSILLEQFIFTLQLQAVVIFSKSYTNWNEH